MRPLADSVISLGDYVLTSGELASMVVIDAVVRKDRRRDRFRTSVGSPFSAV